MNKLTLLDKYISKQLIDTFLLGIIIFTSIMFASDTFLSLVKQMSAYGISLKIAILLVILNLPYIIVFTIPMAVLLSTILTFNKLSLNSEITVIRACGISITRLALPVLVFGLSAAILSFIISEFIVPAANTQAKSLTIWALSQKNIPEGTTNFSFQELNDNGQLKRLFYIDSYDNKELKGITVLDMSNEGATQIIQAKYGDSKPEHWNFKQGVIYTISQDGKIMNTTVFDQLKLFTNFTAINKDKHKARELNFFELTKYISHQKSKGNKNLAELSIELQEKLALPITSILVTLVGIPLAITPPRARFNRGLLFSIFIIFCYYMFRAFSISLGEASKLDSTMAAWLPNIIIAIVGFLLFYKKAYKI
ncbi:MAG: hypothetical protein A2287_01695 [Candidatus Melainabacteria bacterium RIFOXYA12_FULL_32_12]|nr:MAG: hypothetical protein A2104_01640 [Candidatus Melainabacteria bacterium GWF2_32_7]OGI18445.1 MAG: hypothetical protein A2255_04085 [Candidatus Melainabacteria bacterium RIFOXYA2_FULL_32_9]OGI27220.1 MAG: hypothetical protein A2287_01695 [Candidatus Melainabacteria bacterium RIFOXYA12_FULL_32_12]